MKKIFFLFSILFIYGCSNTKTVLICGDHVCINKAEAEQYFEDNLTLEVKVVDKKKLNELNIIELNLKPNTDGSKKIIILDKKEANQEIKILTNKEIEVKKTQLKKRKEDKIKNKKKENKILKKEKKLNKITKKKEIVKKISDTKKNIIKQDKNKFDICTIIEECSIDEISKYLIKKGKEKDFPDITARE